jgi:dihydropyrimidine dehydrogenase (NAD+) subunit PreT
MDKGSRSSEITSGRLSAEEYRANFSDLHAPLTTHEAHVEADRCYFCYDAPCVTACPTSIDIPKFIRQIQTENPVGSAKTIFEQNILGGMCARVCPTETLCEQVCVREEAEGKPVKIGQLQRFATDYFMRDREQPFTRAEPTSKKVAVIGAGPAGLSCAHRLSSLGHDVVIFEAKDKPGGLSEYGIAAYKTVDDFAQAEVNFVLSIGGISVECGMKLGENVSLDDLRTRFDAVFLGMGMAGVNSLGQEGEELSGVKDAVDYISDLRQASDLSTLKVGRNVVVIGGGMTAVDAAIQSKLLGAENVTMVYRRGKSAMKASEYEQELAQTKGVKIIFCAQPVRLIEGDNGKVAAVEFEYTSQGDGGLEGTGEIFTLDADMVFKAIGQKFFSSPVAGKTDVLKLKEGRIEVDENRHSTLKDVWAGGDCIAGGEDLTVAAVEDGKVAAQSIHQYLGS